MKTKKKDTSSHKQKRGVHFMYARDDFSGFSGIVVRARKSLSLSVLYLFLSLFFLTNSFFSL